MKQKVRFELSVLHSRKCGFCNKDIKDGDIVYQIPIDRGPIGFVYIHKECIHKLEPLRIV